jgi:hypothetical protein
MLLEEIKRWEMLCARSARGELNPDDANELEELRKLVIESSGTKTSGSGYLVLANWSWIYGEYLTGIGIGKFKESDDLEDLITKANAAGIPFTEELLKQAGNAQLLAAALASALASQQALGSVGAGGNGEPNTDSNSSNSNTKTTPKTTPKITQKTSQFVFFRLSNC